MMRMKPLSSLLLLTCLAVAPAGLADPLAVSSEDGVTADIPAAEWRAMAEGRTLVYRIEGELWAYEHYYPGTHNVTLQLYDGTCMQGTWDYSAPLYCFHWDIEGTACFRHIRRNGEILIVEAGTDNGTPLIQKMSEVTDHALTCKPPTS